MQLKQIRQSRKLTVPKLSELSGVPIRTIENIEKRGEGTISNAKKLAKALGVTLDELCEDDKTE